MTSDSSTPSERPSDAEEAPSRSRRVELSGTIESAHRTSDPIEDPWHRVLRGRKPGETYVRILRPHAGRLLSADRGHLVATERALEPRGGVGRAWGRLRRLLIGRPLTATQLPHERLSKKSALAVFASDALSSSTYATEEILLVLSTAGLAGLGLTTPVALAIVLLLAIVVVSYRQVIRAYPGGGGSYVVTRDNLGTGPALVAAASLMVDYILTVAVSISAGVAAITSAFPALQTERVPVAVGFIALITVVNLRGARESAAVFTVPTYLFVVAMLSTIGLGLVRIGTGDLNAALPAESLPEASPVEAVSAFLVLRAFASGCSALTGTEAVSDGVSAFKEPSSRNAQTTLLWMGALLAALFLGISFLAQQLQIVPRHDETVVSQIARAVHGASPGYFVVQIATTVILILAANTSFADFPRVSSFLARDGFMPHQFQFRGERLAFSTGIVALGFLASVLVVVFDASTHALIPLYAVGVFTSFTLSQSSMVRRWWVRREQGWQRGLVINGIGAATTAVVAIEVAAVKFTHGAWMVLLLVPILVIAMRGIGKHYRHVADALSLESAPPGREDPTRPQVVVPIAGLNRGTLKALRYARSIATDVTAVFVTDDMAEAEELRTKWERWAGDIRLDIIESPFRALIEPLLDYVDAMDARRPGPITVVIPEFVPRYLWEFPLHNQTALRLKTALLFRPNTVVIDVPYHL